MLNNNNFNVVNSKLAIVTDKRILTTKTNKVMTTSEFLKIKLNEYNLNDCVHDSNLEYNWIEFYSFDDSDFDAIANFLDFLKECNVISIEPNDKYLMCRFL